MADTNINLYFQDQSNTGTAAEPIDENKPNVSDPSQPKGNNAPKAIGAAVALKVAKTAAQQAAARAGQIYGSNQLQDQINSVGTLVGYGMAIAINPAMGIAMMGLDMGFQLMDYFIAKKDEQRTLSVLRARAGSSLNRSR